MKLLEKKAVIFGAGKIGRSFIGQLFSRGGYEVVFVDVYKPVIDELNRRGNYNVVVKCEQETVMNIKNVRGVMASDEEAVAHEIATAHILAVSIGQQGLKSAITLISKGLLFRKKKMYNIPLDIIIAENLRNAAEYFKTELIPLLPATYPFEKLVGLVETSIGKMVPIMLKKDMEEDILQVFGEPYNTLVLDKMAFKNPIPEIAGLAPKENMKAWVDRKLFIHNLGHATVAYLGHLSHPDSIFLFEVLSDNQLKEEVRNTMLQAADILLAKYPEEFTIESLTEHIDDLLRRFQNVTLGDTIYRVGCDLQRKLGAEDRISGAIHLACELNLPYHLILKALVSGCHFNATDEHGETMQADTEFRKINSSGIENVLTSICGFDKVDDQIVISEAMSINSSMIFVNTAP
jgi:mannitol-1-phosphate 5-dehydrogenase